MTTTEPTRLDEIARAIGDPGSVLPRAEGESVTRWSARAVESLLAPAPCAMKHTPPMDFAWCDTHDTTFPLGSKCKFDGREPWEVYADEADEQRSRAVMAELKAERLAEAPFACDTHACGSCKGCRAAGYRDVLTEQGNALGRVRALLNNQRPPMAAAWIVGVREGEDSLTSVAVVRYRDVLDAIGDVQ